MPAVAGGDIQRVDVGARQQIAEIPVRRAGRVAVVGVNRGFGAVAVVFDNVAYGANADIVLMHKNGQQLRTAASDADDPHGYGVGRANIRRP